MKVLPRPEGTSPREAILSFGRVLLLLWACLSCSRRLEFPQLSEISDPLVPGDTLRVLGSAQLEKSPAGPRILFLEGVVPGQVEWKLDIQEGKGRALALDLELFSKRACPIRLGGLNSEGKEIQAFPPRLLILVPGKQTVYADLPEGGLAVLSIVGQRGSANATLLIKAASLVSFRTGPWRAFDAGPSGDKMPASEALTLPGAPFRDGSSLLFGDGILLDRDQEIPWPEGAGAVRIWGEGPGEEIWRGGWTSLLSQQPRSGAAWRELQPTRPALIELKKKGPIPLKAGSKIRAMVAVDGSGDLEAATRALLAYDEAQSPLPKVLEEARIRVPRTWTENEEKAGISLRVVATRSDQEAGKILGARPMPVQIARNESQFIPLRVVFLRRPRGLRWTMEQGKSRDGKHSLSTKVFWIRPWPVGDGSGTLAWEPSLLSPGLPEAPEAGEEFELWAAFQTLADTEPGLYESALVIQAGGEELARISFLLRVRPLTLPKGGYPFLAVRGPAPGMAGVEGPGADLSNAWISGWGGPEARLHFRGGRQKVWGADAELLPADHPRFLSGVQRKPYGKSQPWGWTGPERERLLLRRSLARIGAPLLLVVPRAGRGDRVLNGPFAHLSGMAGSIAGDFGPGPDPFPLEGLPLTLPGPEGPIWTTAAAWALRGWEDRLLLTLLERAAVSAKGPAAAGLRVQAQKLRQELAKSIPQDIDLSRGNPDLVYFEVLTAVRKEAIRILMGGGPDDSEADEVRIDP